jgi:hypothetical protein
MKMIGIVMVLAVAATATAAPKRSKNAAKNAGKDSSKAVGKGFWKVLVTANAKWELVDTIADDKKKAGKIVVETYDVRKVGGADVARLRWKAFDSTGAAEDFSCSGCYTQVAVTSAGMFIVSDAKDDKQIEASLKKDKPSRSDPPKAYKGTKQNDGRYLAVREGSPLLVCYGEGPLPDAGECADVCFAEICVSAEKGVVSIEGTWAPNYSIYEQAGSK